MPNQKSLSPEAQNEITKALSTARLKNYLKATNGRRDKAIQIYQLNLQLCAALYPSLNTFEITFRNKINDALTETYGSQWYECDDIIKRYKNNNKIIKFNGRWITEHNEKTATMEYQSIQKAISNLKAISESIDDNIIPELNFGFWFALIFDSKYKQKVWINCSKKIFSNCTSKDRDYIYKNKRELKEYTLYLRNRVFHYEPIWQKNYNVESRHASLCELLEWMSPEVHDWLKTYDNFPEQHRVFQEELKELNIANE